MRNMRTYRMVTTAMLTAAACILYLFEIPLFSNYLKIDFSDIPALAAGITFGPLWGAAVEILKNFFHLITKGVGSTMGFGDLMNTVVGCAFIVPFSAICRGEKGKTVVRLILSCLCAFAAIVVFGLLGNWIVAPMYFRAFVGIELSEEALIAAVTSATLLNVVKGGLLCLMGCVLYKPLMLLNKRYAVKKNVDNA